MPVLVATFTPNSTGRVEVVHRYPKVAIRLQTLTRRSRDLSSPYGRGLKCALPVEDERLERSTFRLTSALPVHLAIVVRDEHDGILASTPYSFLLS